MLSGKKILVTGPAGQIAFPLCEYLSPDNEVWGIARFSEPGSRERVDALGVTTRFCDLSTGECEEIPEDFEYLLHLAAYQGSGNDQVYANQVNAQSSVFLMEHCRRAKAVLVMSTSSVYQPHEDPFHHFVESDPLGGARTPWAPTYAESKILEEEIVKEQCRELNLPTVIARMNASYGPHGGLPAYTLDSIRRGDTVAVRWDPCPYTPICQSDINEQLEALLSAASVPATIVNWGGDEVVTLQEWADYFGELCGLPVKLDVHVVEGSHRGNISDASNRRSLTGPCKTSWRDGMRWVFEERPLTN